MRIEEGGGGEIDVLGSVFVCARICICLGKQDVRVSKGEEGWGLEALS